MLEPLHSANRASKARSCCRGLALHQSDSSLAGSPAAVAHSRELPSGRDNDLTEVNCSSAATSENAGTQ